MCFFGTKQLQDQAGQKLLSTDPVLQEVSSQGLLPWRSLTRAWSPQVSDSGLLPWQSLPCTCSCGGHCLGPALAKVTGSGLLQYRSLTQAYFHRYPQFGPAPGEVPGLSLVPQRSLWLGPAPLEIPDLQDAVFLCLVSF